MEAQTASRAASRTWDKQSVALIAIESLGQRTSYFARALDTGLSLEAYTRADNEPLWAYEKIVELEGAAGAHSRFFRRLIG